MKAEHGLRHTGLQTVHILYTRPLCQKARWSFSFASAALRRTKAVIGAFGRRIDISECTFFALLIYQLTFSEKCFGFVLFFSDGCNITPSAKEMFTKLLQILPNYCGWAALFYAKQRSIQVAQFFGSSLFISSMLSIHPENSEQYLYVFVFEFCNLHLSFCSSFCYHNCIQRGVCRTPVTMMFSILGGEQK